MKQREINSPYLMDKIKIYYQKNKFKKTIIWFFKNTIKSILQNIICVKNTIMIMRSVEGDLPASKKLIGNFNFKIATKEDIILFRSNKEIWGRLKKLYEKRLSMGKICIFCHDNKQTIGYTWISFNEEIDRPLGITVAPAEDEAYGYDTYVLPEYRKFLIGYELMSRFMQYSKAQAKKKTIGLVGDHNKVFIRALKMAYGGRERERIKSITFLNRYGIELSRKTKE